MFKIITYDVGQRYRAKLQWLQDPSEINGDNLNNIKCKVSRHFRKNEREYLTDKINKNCRDL
jgi:hypothetical protein